MKTIRPKLATIIFCVFFLVPVLVFAQYPKLEVELITNLSKISCLDDFEVKAKQINWQAFDFYKQEFLFKEILFSAPDTGYAITLIQGAGIIGFFAKTYDGGKTWNLDETLNYKLSSCIHLFGKDTVILMGKNFVSWYVYEYFQYHSYDGGITWDSIQTNLKIDLQKSFFLRPDIGYAVDSNGQTYYSNNLGETWENRGIIGNGDIIKIWFLDQKVGFILTSNELFKTIDGGNSWIVVKLPFEFGFTDLAFKDNIGFITGKLGIILKTEDYGNSWDFSNTRLLPHLNSIKIISCDSVFVVGDNGTILFSDNGGKTWNPQFSDTKEALNTIDFFDLENITIGGNFVFLKYYPPEIIADYAWQPTELLVSKQDNRANFYSTESTSVSVIGRCNSGNDLSAKLNVDVSLPGLFISHDSLANFENQIQLHTLTNTGTWKMSIDIIGETWFHDVYFINQDVGFIVGQFNEKGIILKSTDGGEIWYNIPQKIKLRLDDIEFVSPQVGYASGYLGYMVKTTDGGNTWFEIETPTKEDIKSISFIDEKVGYAAANNGNILKTTNGGVSWEVTKLNYDWAFKILFLNESDGFLLHNYSGFHSTSDGGKTWTEVEHDKFFDVMDIYFANENIGYVIGGMLGPFHYLKTIDGGKNWHQKIYSRGDLMTYNVVRFHDQHSGFVFNSIGEIIATGDGGQNWFVLDTLRHPLIDPGNIGYNIQGFHFIEPNKAIGISNGQIFHFKKSNDLKYSWYPYNSVLGKNRYHPWIPATGGRSYYCKIERPMGCEIWGMVEVDLLTNTKIIEYEDDLIVYPIPANKSLTVEYKNLHLYDRIELIDLTGKISFNLPISHYNQITITPNLTPGIYYLRLIGKETIMHKKVSFY